VAQSLIVSELALVLCVAAAWFLGGRIARARPSQDNEGGGAHLTDSVAFVGGAFGLILGLLLVFSVQHFNDAQNSARLETVNTVALFHAANPYPEDQRAQLRRDVVCLMRSTETTDWEAASSLDLTGSEDTSAWAARVQNDVEALTVDTNAQKSNHFFLTQDSLDLARNRQLRLLFALPDIPLVVWLVIYVCSFVFTGLLVIHLWPRRRVSAISVTATTLILIAVIGTLNMLDMPYVDIGGTADPVAMRASLIQLEDAFPGPIWAPCEQLAPSVPH
jgi:protein-S-isoprenylcysteine O-methyltransferase Ste14